MDDLEKYAMIVIYPDGSFEGNKISNYDCHMEYLILLANSSPRLLDIFKRNDIELSLKSEAARQTTYKADLKLAKEGIIVLHNMVLDDETLQGFYITTPSTVNDVQKQTLNQILDGFDMQDGWLGYLEDNELIDVSFDNAKDIFGKI